MRYSLLLSLLISLPCLAQTNRYTLTEKDTLITCDLTNRTLVAGPFSDAPLADFDKLVEAVFSVSPFPVYPYSIFRTKDPSPVRLGCHSYDELEYHTFLLYNLDSAMDFNLKARSRFGLMSLLAHEVGHHAFHHFLPWPNENIATQELQADYFAGWILAKLNVPETDITKGLSAMTSSKGKTSNYPTEEERSSATLLGYTIARTAGIGPLAVLESGNTLSDEWLTKWSRVVNSNNETVVLSESMFTDVVLELDSFGQLLYKNNDTEYVVARVMPSKDRLHAYLIFDNQFNYWWIEKDGTVKDAKEQKTIGSVNLQVLNKNNP